MNYRIMYFSKLIGQIGVMTLCFYLTSCEKDLLTPQDELQSPGEVIIKGYAQTDTLYIVGGGTDTLEVNGNKKLIGGIEANHRFVYFNRTSEHVSIIKKTGEGLKSYDLGPGQKSEIFSFFHKPGIWLDDVLEAQPGTLSQENHAGLKLIFPNMNTHSNSGYQGGVDAVLSRFPSGEHIATIENVGDKSFSSFVEFAFSIDPGSPVIPVITLELVKHGTTESYLPGNEPLTTLISIQPGDSKLVLIEEGVDLTGAFDGIHAFVDLTQLFDYPGHTNTPGSGSGDFQIPVWQDDFNDLDASDWRLVDMDNDGHNWETGYAIAVDETTFQFGDYLDYPVLGSYVLDFSTFGPYGPQDNWAVSPEITMELDGGYYGSGTVKLVLNAQSAIGSDNRAPLLYVYASTNPDFEDLEGSFTDLGSIVLDNPNNSSFGPFPPQFTDKGLDVTAFVESLPTPTTPFYIALRQKRYIDGSTTSDDNPVYGFEINSFKMTATTIKNQMVPD